MKCEAYGSGLLRAQEHGGWMRTYRPVSPSCRARPGIHPSALAEPCVYAAPWIPAQGRDDGVRDLSLFTEKVARAVRLT